MELALADPQEVTTVQTYIPRSLTRAPRTSTCSPATVSRGDVSSSPTFIHSTRPGGEEVQVRVVSWPWGTVCSGGSMVTVGPGHRGAWGLLGWS